MNRALLTLFLLLISWHFCFANPERIAVLEKELRGATDSTRVNILLELAKLNLRINGQIADSIASMAYLEAIDSKFLSGKIKSIIYLGNIKSFNGQSEKAELFCERALFLSDSINNYQLLSEGYNLLYLLYYRRGQYDSATIAANKSLEIALQSEHQEMLARGYQNLGILNSIQGNHPEAIRFFLLSEQTYKELGDEFARAMVLGNLGVTFEEAGNYQKALEYMSVELEIGEHLKDNFLISSALADIGAVYSQMNLPDSSIAYYERSLIIAKQASNYDLMILNLENIGSYYSNKGRHDDATSYLMSAHNMAIEKGFDYQNVYITGHLAQNYLAQQKYDSALVYALEQLNLALEYEFLYDQKLAYDNLSKIYEANKDFEKSNEALLNYILINDSLFSQDKTRQIEGLREQYESEKKEQEIENLKAINEVSRYRNISYGGAAISFFILGGLLYYLQRSRIKRNRILLEKEKELDRMKSRFFANISHEFRTPLTLILSPIDSLITKIDQADIKKQLKVMKRNASRLLDLVNQLLDLSKLESGKLKLNVAYSDIIAVIKGVSMSFQSIAEQKNIEIELDVVPEQLYINYDRPKIETVLTNLLSNAFKFAPDNSAVKIQVFELSTSSALRQKEVVHISVTDNGPGISKEDAEQIFDRFYQSEKNQLWQQEGSGIGLALTKELVDLHGGNISVNSELGKGTQITVELPIDILPSETTFITEEVNQDEKVLKIHEVLEEKKIEEDINSQLPLVLLIEDNVDVRNYTSEILGKEYNVQTAENGAIGVDKAFDIIPDLIISDVMMPMKDGFEVCAELKNDEKTSHIPIILLTAKSDSEDKIEGLMTAADDYVTKPFVPKELQARIQNLIDSRKRLIEKYKSEGILKPKDVATNSIDVKFLDKIVELVEINMSDEKFGVEQLGIEIGMSRSQLHRKMKALVDQGPNQFIRSFRLQRAHDLLKQNSATASEIAYKVGFSSPSYFTKCFHEQYGYTPSEIPA